MSKEENKEESSAVKMLHEVNEKNRIEKQKTEKAEEKGNQLALSQLEQLRDNRELSEMYSESAQLGSENLSGELPLLKVHSVGKSTKNELSNGDEPKDGAFFYKQTGEQFESVRCHILTISKGFRAEGMEKKSIFNQVMGGVIISGTEMKPFIMYMTGLKLSPMWEFGKEASKYTKMKPVAIPMFALTVKFTTKKVANAYGKSWVIDFEIEKTEDGSPVLVMDPEEFKFLKNHVEIVEDTIESLISAKAIKGDEAAGSNGDFLDSKKEPESDTVEAGDEPF